MDVVRNENQRAFVTLQCERERLNGVDVEVRGRFVHQQKVRRIHEKFHEVQPAFFATAQNFCEFINVIFAKHERAEHSARLVLAHFFSAGQNFVEHGFFWIQRGRAMLAEITDLRIVAEVAFAFLNFNHARENF